MKLICFNNWKSLLQNSIVQMTKTNEISCLVAIEKGHAAAFSHGAKKNREKGHFAILIIYIKVLWFVSFFMLWFQSEDKLS